MNDKNELFPFPVLESEQPDNKPESSLPSFPEKQPDNITHPSEAPLTKQEIAELRSMLTRFKNPQTKSAQQAATIVKLSTPTKSGQSKDLIEKWLKLVANSEEPALAAVAKDMAELAQTIDNENISTKVLMALFGLLPVKKYLRHGTPEQQMFTLSVMGNRFLTIISSASFAERKKLLKSVARTLSLVCDKFTFVQTEGEVFNPQHHERLRHSSSSGRYIREMHSFLVIEATSNKVIRSSQVLT